MFPLVVGGGLSRASLLKRRALGSFARSPRPPPCTPHSRFKDLVGSAPRAPPPKIPPARAASIQMPRLRRAFRGVLAPLRALAKGGVPAGSRRWAPRCRRARALERGASPTEVRAAPPPGIWRSSACKSPSVRGAETSRGGPPSAPPPCRPRPHHVGHTPARYLTRACC